MHIPAQVLFILFVFAFCYLEWWAPLWLNLENLELKRAAVNLQLNDDLGPMAETAFLNFLSTRFTARSSAFCNFDRDSRHRFTVLKMAKESVVRNMLFTNFSDRIILTSSALFCTWQYQWCCPPFFEYSSLKHSSSLLTVVGWNAIWKTYL
jgi:hypothetical protein